jgi:hypothetical protein
MGRLLALKLSLSALLTVIAADGVLAVARRACAPALRRTLDEILSSGYQLQVPMQVRLQDRVLQLLRRLAEGLDGLGEMSPLVDLPLWLNWVVFGACLALLLLMLAHIALTLREVLLEKSPRRVGEREAGLSADPRDLLAAAEAAFAAGDGGQAVRLLYHAVLLRLDYLDLLPYDPARTNWENAATLTAGPELHDAMLGLAREVDECAYAGGRVSSQSWERSREWAGRMWGGGEAR